MPGQTPSTNPSAIDGATSESIVNLLRMLWATEVYSAETYTYILETYEGLTSDHRRKLEACRRLEVAMSRLLFEHLTRDLGVELRPPARARQVAESLATRRYGSWFDRMSDLEGAAIRGVMAFRALKTMYGESQPRLCAVQLAHEMALRDFARDELDGETETSLNRILALLDPEDRRAVESPAPPL